MKATAFILCAGEASRFPHAIAKQLFTIDGVSILGRTIRQLRTAQEPPDIFVVTHKTDIACEAGKEGARVICPTDHRFTCASAVATKDYWTHRNFIMCGDVYWTAAALDSFLAPRFSEVTYATDGTDIFGMEFTFPQCGFVAAAFYSVIAEGQPRYGGRLHASRKYLPGAYYLRITDRTQDFDTLEEYENFLKGRSKRRVFVPLRRHGIAKG